MRRVLSCLIGAVIALAACTREPRGVSYFESHPQAAKAVVAACKSGERRGGECDTADAGLAHAAATARMAIYRKSFR